MFKIMNGGLIKRDITWTGCIFGSPKSGKTSLGASFSKPLLIDLDHGAHRVAGKDRAGMDIVVCETWKDVEALASDPAIKDYKTLILDTFGAAVDMIIRDEFSNTMNPAKWGAVKTKIMTVCNQLKLSGRSVLFLAHESEEKSDDKIIKRPQCQGKAKDELMKMLDFIGHTTKQGTDFVLEFGGDDSIYVGNTFGFKNRYVLPDIKVEDNTFGRDVLEKQIADYLVADEEANEKLRETMDTCRAAIRDAKTADQFTKTITAITSAQGLTPGATLKLKRELMDAAKAAKMRYDATTGGFVADKAEEPEKQETAREAE